VASEQAIVCGVHLPGRSPGLWPGSVTLAISGPVLAQGRGSEKPNVVLMLADNVGASDVLAKEPPIKPGTPDSYTPGR
jgi:hypothetical protein